MRATREKLICGPRPTNVGSMIADTSFDTLGQSPTSCADSLALCRLFSRPRYIVLCYCERCLVVFFSFFFVAYISLSESNQQSCLMLIVVLASRRPVFLTEFRSGIIYLYVRTLFICRYFIEMYTYTRS